jgi:hypothetical protein
MPAHIRPLAAMLLAGMLAPSSLSAADVSRDTLAGVWRATNDCFLRFFVLIDGGRAQALYMTGERDENAVWTWDGATLHIVSQTFPLDRFDGKLTNDGVQADYTWHDLDRDQLNTQTCAFERYMPTGI